MGSRIAHHIDFPDYSLDELVAIAHLMLAEQQYEFSDEADESDSGGDGGENKGE